MGRRWSNEEMRILRKFYPIMRVEDVARKLGKSKEATYQRAARSGITRAPRSPKWSDAETEILRKLYPVMSVQDLVVKLGKTRPAIYQHASLNGITKCEPRQLRRKKPVRVTKWANTYTAIHSHDCLLYKQRVPAETRTKGVGAEQRFAIYRIFPTDVEKYWKGLGVDVTTGSARDL